MSKISNLGKRYPSLLKTTIVTKDAKIWLMKQDLLRSCVNYQSPLNNPVTPVGPAARRFWTTGLGIGSGCYVNRPASGNACVCDGTGRDGTGRDGTGRDGTGRDGTGRDGTGRDAATRRNMDITLTNKINTNISEGVIHFKSSSHTKYLILKFLQVSQNRAKMIDAGFGIIHPYFTFTVVKNTTLYICLQFYIEHSVQGY
jgi:hypothetical protein